MLAFITRPALRKMFISLAVVLVLLPVCTIVFLIVFKTKIQQGKIFPSIGPLLLLVAPPTDLWKPLGKSMLSDAQFRYKFDVIHKYAGNHTIDISIKRLDSYEKLSSDLSVQLDLYQSDNIIYSRKDDSISSYWGSNSSGLLFVRYKVPQDAPVSVPLKAVITVKGDLKTFLSRYGPAQILLRKCSDL